MQKGITMRSLVMAIVLFLTVGNKSFAQDIVKVRNQNFTSYYSKSQHLPVLVVYTLTPELFECSKAKGEAGIKLDTDPQLTEYTNLATDYMVSNFESSQVMAPEENTCDRDAYRESFYFTNVFPMPKNLYKNLWEKLHEKEMAKARKYKKVKVFAGTVGRNWVIGANHNVIVPEYCWKVIYIPSTDEYLCYEFHNIEPYTDADNRKEKLEMHKVDLNQIESLAGVHFVNGVVTASYVSPAQAN